MALQVFTAQFRYSGPDRLDITRSSAHNMGVVMGLDVPGAIFAPSWAIVDQFRHRMESAGRLQAYGRNQTADHLLRAAWDTYSVAYKKEMRESYKLHSPGWEKILKMESATLVCFCPRPEHCHRIILARILVKLGAEYFGERVIGSTKEQGR